MVNIILQIVCKLLCASLHASQYHMRAQLHGDLHTPQVVCGVALHIENFCCKICASKWTFTLEWVKDEFNFESIEAWFCLYFYHEINFVLLLFGWLMYFTLRSVMLVAPIEAEKEEYIVIAVSLHFRQIGNLKTN